MTVESRRRISESKLAYHARLRGDPQVRRAHLELRRAQIEAELREITTPAPSAVRSAIADSRALRRARHADDLVPAE